MTAVMTPAQAAAPTAAAMAPVVSGVQAAYRRLTMHLKAAVMKVAVLYPKAGPTLAAASAAAAAAATAAAAVITPLMREMMLSWQAIRKLWIISNNREMQ